MWLFILIVIITFIAYGLGYHRAREDWKKYD